MECSGHEEVVTAYFSVCGHIQYSIWVGSMTMTLTHWEGSISLQWHTKISAIQAISPGPPSWVTIGSLTASLSRHSTQHSISNLEEAAKPQWTRIEIKIIVTGSEDEEYLQKAYPLKDVTNAITSAP